MIYLNTDNSGTFVVTPEVDNSNMARIYGAKNSSVLIPEENNSSSTGVTTLVDCVSPKEELYPPNIEVECVSDDYTVPTFHESEDSDSYDRNDKDNYIHHFRRTHGKSSKGLYVNSEDL